MDKKNTTIGVILLILAFGSFIYTSRHAPQSPVVATATTAAPAATPGQTPAVSSAVAFPAAPENSTAFAALVSDNADATITKLANEYVELRLTDFGGAISNVAFKKYAAAQDGAGPFVFNETHAAPILAFENIPGLDQKTRFQLVSATTNEVVYRAVLENRIEVTRRYTLRAPGDITGDPYRIRHETTFRNLTNLPAPVPNVLNLGTSALVSANDAGLHLNVLSYDGEDLKAITRNDLQGGGLLSAIGITNSPPKNILEQAGKVEWGAITNQFFTSIFTPEKSGVGIAVRRVELPPLSRGGPPNVGLTGNIKLDLSALPANGTASFTGDLYVGPKEYKRLATFTHNEDKAMQYSNGYTRIFFSGVVSPAMNTLMNWMHSFVGNWGVAIILMTLLLKVISLPFTLAASRSAKRMQKLQPLMQAVREKYKDQPQKLNQATMELFKEHKVNPMGGCIPILITIPLFVGFFSMLQGTAELRFQSFLWAHDLSAPDTIGHLFGLPVNIMPILMGATMIFQMRLTPQPSIDSTQQTIFKFMPILFTLFCYNFPCGLALYSTINGLFTIGQQLVVNKYTVDATPTPLGVPSGTGKKIKNVTPPKKKK